MNTSKEINNMLTSELSPIYRAGYDDGYNHGVNGLFDPKSKDAEYLDGYGDGQADASEIE
jgi:hypothetical protein